MNTYGTGELLADVVVEFELLEFVEFENGKLPL